MVIWFSRAEGANMSMSCSSQHHRQGFHTMSLAFALSMLPNESVISNKACLCQAFHFAEGRLPSCQHYPSWISQWSFRPAADQWQRVLGVRCRTLKTGRNISIVIPFSLRLREGYTPLRNRVASVLPETRPLLRFSGDEARESSAVDGFIHSQASRACLPLVITISAGTSANGPTFLATCLTQQRTAFRSPSERFRGSQMTPPFPPPRGISTTAHFQSSTLTEHVQYLQFPGMEPFPPLQDSGIDMLMRNPLKTLVVPSSIRPV
jgi:hypothetical protein